MLDGIIALWNDCQITRLCDAEVPFHWFSIKCDGWTDWLSYQILILIFLVFDKSVTDRDTRVHQKTKNDDELLLWWRGRWPDNDADGVPDGTLDALLTISEETKSITIEASYANFFTSEAD